MLKHSLRRSFRYCLAGSAVLAASAAFAQSQPPIKIGFMVTLSGPLAIVGQEQYDGFMQAVEERGGKLGGVPVEILKEDDQFKPEVATQIVTKLITRDHVPIISGISGSNVAMAVAKSITDKGVFMISTNAGPSPLAGASCSPNLFVASWQNDMQSESVGKYASDKGYKRVVALAPNYQAGKDYISGFKRYYTGKVVDEIYTPVNQLDFSAELTQIAADKPDAIFAFYPGALGISFVRQYRLAGLDKTIPILSAGILEIPAVTALKDSALGALGGTFWSPDVDNPTNKHFVEKFESKHNRIPSTWAAQGYDGALLLDSAIAKVKGNVADKDAFRAALKAADFKSVRGKFRFNNNHFPIQDMRVVEAVKDAKGRYTVHTVATPLKDHQDAFHTQCPMS
ncbi:MAG TPA: ABC transporter substrate-binding protein [Eoetvoesiella sp.]|uniref:ABC transporter substrate-binding protein n=1 Tax=Eoetvoesiella sp. TaxID=1966355 RepID=UPI002C6DC6DD|nr:ABC transporter substrate-binding protein [Eoetvoesiella sp.]HWK60830.1 ABC transporter substrate-binding protein [Eoetvoesiella sp.]